jgi:hypothetical protein
MPQSNIEGVQGILVKLHTLAGKGLALQRARVSAGYASPHAIHVHENREMKLKGQPRPSGIGVYWGPTGRAGFLTDVALQMRGLLHHYLVSLLKVGMHPAEALYKTASMLMAASKKNVPIEHGDLVNSAFVRLS